MQICHFFGGCLREAILQHSLISPKVHNRLAPYFNQVFVLGEAFTCTHNYANHKRIMLHQGLILLWNFFEIISETSMFILQGFMILSLEILNGTLLLGKQFAMEHH